MNNNRTISDYKAKAKENLLGNYGIAVVSFALLFVTVYCIAAILMEAYFSGFRSKEIYDTVPGASNISIISYFKSNLVLFVIEFVIGIFTDLFMVGYIYILRELSYHRKASRSGLFFAFKNHPDTVIIIAMIICLCRRLLTLPGDILGYFCTNTADSNSMFNGKLFFFWMLFGVCGFIAYLYIYLGLIMSYQVYLSDTSLSAMDCIKKSIRLMKGQKFRCLYIFLSLIGYWLLGIVGAVVGCLWVEAYQTMIMIEFFKDLNGEFVVSDKVNDVQTIESDSMNIWKD